MISKNIVFKRTHVVKLKDEQNALLPRALHLNTFMSRDFKRFALHFAMPLKSERFCRLFTQHLEKHISLIKHVLFFAVE